MCRVNIVGGACSFKRKGEEKMVDFRRSAPQIPLVLASLVLWVSFAWALPGDSPESEGDDVYSEGVPTVSYDPFVLDSATYDEVVEDSLMIARAGKWVCPGCGKENKASEDYCTACGEVNPTPRERKSSTKIYEEIKCPQCGKKNELDAARCYNCGLIFPQPSEEVTDPDMVFVPGRGYYRKGEMIEPGHPRRGLLVTGLVIGGIGLVVVSFSLVAMMGKAIGSIAGGGADTDTEEVVFIVGGAMVIGGGIMALVGFCNKTDPIYAFHTGELDEGYDGVACERAPVGPGNLEFKIEVPVLSF